ncbi:aspartic peptidase domain-containing protein [Vararia minispora EC-137]|uniref:Aspartic peptidase domain-containing protein n=1 Tax=Vararia minispora EC-137 TaxID=1314806 RepID=A0ACB8QLA9_9AGAM|nr:aspartic peptidase domain-containing protein [Vararia minispora EC-137]
MTTAGAVAVLGCLAYGVAGLRLEVTRRDADSNVLAGRAPGSSDELIASSSNGLQQVVKNRGFNAFYTANITLGGIELPVVIDSGSPDLWVVTHEEIPAAFLSDVQADITYGSGKVGGVIAYAPFSIGSREVKNQAFISVTDASGADQLLNNGAKGLLGLGFNMPAVGINRALATTLGPDNMLETNPVATIFSQDAILPRFFTTLFGRAEDALAGPVGGDGVLTVGEYVNGMEKVADAPKLRRFIPHGEEFEAKPRWTALLEGILVHGRQISVHSAFVDVPTTDRASALLDTGTTLSAVPSYIAEEIYGRMDGAFLAENLGGAGRKDWVLPCDAVVDVSLVFGGQQFPVHPLDLSRPKIVNVDGEEPRTVCVGTYEANDKLPEYGMDMLFGGSFLLNTYTSFSFGDIEGPFMQLLSITDPEQARVEFTTRRREELARLPLELSRAEVMQLLNLSPDDHAPGSPPKDPAPANAAPDDAAPDDTTPTTKTTSSVLDGEAPNAAPEDVLMLGGGELQAGDSPWDVHGVSSLRLGFFMLCVAVLGAATFILVRRRQGRKTQNALPTHVAGWKRDD